jgi:ribosomal-protein-alanine N-acetyltransferase
LAVAQSIVLRMWSNQDRDALTKHASNRKIWLNLRDRFPHPYTRADAEAWIAFCAAPREGFLQFAIDLNGEAIGGIGFERLPDVHRVVAEIGYWIAEPFWDQGIATGAVRRAVPSAFDTLGVERIQAMVFESNQASVRVLEKTGFTFEGRLYRNVVKDGRIIDSLMYARLR